MYFKLSHSIEIQIFQSRKLRDQIFEEGFIIQRYTPLVLDPYESRSYGSFYFLSLLVIERKKKVYHLDKRGTPWSYALYPDLYLFYNYAINLIA